jgi:gamma-glutamylcyclotransferase (GGCT)/AIG2-like uncharacterized protein YtfP
VSARFQLFAYGTLRSGGAASHMLRDAEHMGAGQVGGVLYDLDDYPALLLYGDTPVRGEIWNCPATLLRTLDAYERIATGLFRRVGVEVQADDGSCSAGWVYVAGPRLARQLTPARIVESWR